MQTDNYPYFKIQFETFNPVQESCFDYYDEDCNIIISATTASGKSTIAEMIIGYELSEKEQKIVYTSPLKAISQQIKTSWKSNELLSGNMSLLNDRTYERLLIATVEGLDVLVRKEDPFIKELSCVVFDEAHLITDLSRGANAESLIMGLTEQNPNCRIIFLSGTLDNAKEIAQWIKSLNGKTTRFIKSDWRPTELEENILTYTYKDDMYKQMLELINESMYEKILIFVQSKKKGTLLNNFLKNNGVYSDFYSAGKSQYIIDKFRNQGLDVLITTNALAMGMNL